MKFLLHTLVVLVVFQFSITANSETRPNLLILMLDDAGWTDLSSYESRIQTPHMDQLAAEGMRFTDCHAAAPNCSPSRVGMLTGRSPIRAGIFNYLDSRTPMHLEAHEITMANLLQSAGYATGHFGKWHVSRLNSDQAQPADHGYDYYLGTDNNANPSHLNPKNFIRNGKELGEQTGYSCDIVADEAIGWIKKHKAKTTDQPFFSTVWFHEPHRKIASPPRLVAEYKKRYPGISKKEADYMANVANADQAIGRILKTVENLGLKKNTVVFCTSDNGGLNAWSNVDLRGKKSNVWEGGHRVPGIFRWPGKIETGSVSHQTISFLDLLPTFCEIAEVDLPKDRYLDGMNILDHLKTGQEFAREQPLFWFFYRINPSMAYRVGDWVLISNTSDAYRRKKHAISKEDLPYIKSAGLMEFELYNLKIDLEQTTNIIRQNYPQFLKMKSDMERIHKEIVTEGKNWDFPVQDMPLKPVGT